jgi:hypothetical protein
MTTLPLFQSDGFAGAGERAKAQGLWLIVDAPPACRRSSPSRTARKRIASSVAGIRADCSSAARPISIGCGDSDLFVVS